MYTSHFLSIFLLLTALPLLHAQKPLSPSVIAKGIAKTFEVQAVKNGRIPRFLTHESNYLRTLDNNNLEDMDRMLETYFTLNRSLVPKEVLQQNQQMQVEAVHNWIKRDLYAALHPARMTKNVFMDVTTGRIDYVGMIPPETKLVFMGEIHEQGWMVGEVEQAIYEYSRKYPDRHVYYASEFIDATPGEGPVHQLTQEKEVDPLVRKRPFYRDVTKRMIHYNIRVVGLEEPALSQELLEKNAYHTDFIKTELAWKTVAAGGLKARNEYWSSIIRRIYEHDPEAVVFVHAGMAHTNYNHPAALPWMLKQFKSFVVEFGVKEDEDLNTLVDRNVRIPLALYAKGWDLHAARPLHKVRFVRHMKDKRVAVAVGCDLHIKHYSYRK